MMDNNTQNRTSLDLHVRRGSILRACGEGPSVVAHLGPILDELADGGMTNAEALARKWFELALGGNVVALKEILSRYEPVTEPEREVHLRAISQLGSTSLEQRERRLQPATPVRRLQPAPSLPKNAHTSFVRLPTLRTTF